MGLLASHFYRQCNFESILSTTIDSKFAQRKQIEIENEIKIKRCAQYTAFHFY